MKRLFLSLCAAGMLLCFSVSSLAQSGEPFGLPTRALTAQSSKDFRTFATLWSETLGEMARDAAKVLDCLEHEVCTAEARRFAAVVLEARKLHGLERLAFVNREVDRAITLTMDLEQWEEVEHWSPPLEVMRTGRGDCEDYAIAKYLALALAGTPVEDLRLLIVFFPRKPGEEWGLNLYHAVLGVRLDGRWFILDNEPSRVVEDRAYPAVPRLVLHVEAREYLLPATASTR